MGVNDFLAKHDELINRAMNYDKLPPIEPIRDYRMADYQYEVIMRSIKDFEDNLDNEHEVALRLTSFGQSILLHVTDIGYSNPCLIHYYGYVNNKYSELIQHVSQINFLLTSVPKDEPNRKTRRIGFYPNDENSSSSDTDS